MRGVAVVGLAVLLLAGCGGGGGDGRPKVVGSGAGRAWVLRPDGRPKSVVVFVHGLGGPQEIDPTNHLPWLRHLVEQGNAVIYPAYETEPGGTKAVAHILPGVKNGLRELGNDTGPDARRLFWEPGDQIVETARGE